MVCAYCGGGTEVVNSRHQKRNNQVWRRRRCLICGGVFTTHEAADLSRVLMVEDQNGVPRPFLPDLLHAELLLAMQDRKDRYVASREVLGTIVRQLVRSPSHPLFQPTEISKTTAKVLKRFDQRTHLRYVAEHPSLQ
jgi:transcriptional repressor NrdR